MNADVAETRLIEVIHAAFSGNEHMINVPTLAALDLAVVKMGLGPVVRAYLATNFGVERLTDLKPSDLGEAVKFITEVQSKVPPVTQSPLPPGTRIEGEFLWIRGTVTWAGDGPK